VLPLLLMLAARPGQAQEGISAGLRLGPNLTLGRQFQDDQTVDSLKVGPQLGFRGGFMAHYGFTDNIGVYSGFFLDHVVFKPTQELNDHTFRVTYLELPLAARLTSYDLGGGWYLKARAGMGFHLNVGATEKTSATTRRIQDQIRPLMVSALAGIGMEWDFYGGGYLDFGLSYHHGLTNILNQDFKRESGGKPYENPDRTLLLHMPAFYVGFIFK
jgi:hypothetical protein